jgi:hypothetical protein
MVQRRHGYIQGVLVKNAVVRTIFEAADALTDSILTKVTGKVATDSRAPAVWRWT